VAQAVGRDLFFRPQASTTLCKVVCTPPVSIGVVVLAAEHEGKVSLLVAVTRDLTDRVKAGALVKELAPLIGGGGVWLIVTLSTTFGFSDYSAKIIVDIMIMQVPPLFAALFIAMRASPVNNTEIALMKVGNQVAALEALRIDPLAYLCVPRLIGSVACALALAFMLVAMTFAGNELFSWLSARLDYPYHAQDLARIVTFDGLSGVALRSMLFGFFVTLVPLYHGLHPASSDNPVPASVLRGMDNVLLAIILVEGLSLLAS